MVNLVELKIFAQDKSQLDVSKINEFITSVPKAKVALIYSSLGGESESASFFDSCVRDLGLPFVGVRVAGVITPRGYVGDGVVVGVLCGDFDVDVFVEKSDFEDPPKTAKTVVPRLDDADLCMIFLSSTVKKRPYDNHILSIIHERLPNLQLWGGGSVEPCEIVTQDGTYKDSLAFIVFKGVETRYSMDTGFTLDKSREGHVVTDCDLYRIYEIDGENAAEKYCLIQHIQPWFLNKMMSLVMRRDISHLMKVMSSMNKTLYEGFMRSMVKLFGFRLPNGAITAVGITHVNDDYLLSAVYVPKGTILYPTETTAESQIEIYDLLIKEFKESNAVLVSTCLLDQYYSNFEFDKVKAKMDESKVPYIVAYFTGEVGVKPNEKTRIIHHNCSVHALGLSKKAQNTR